MVDFEIDTEDIEELDEHENEEDEEAEDKKKTRAKKCDVSKTLIENLFGIMQREKDRTIRRVLVIYPL